MLNTAKTSEVVDRDISFGLRNMTKIISYFGMVFFTFFVLFFYTLNTFSKKDIYLLTSGPKTVLVYNIKNHFMKNRVTENEVEIVKDFKITLKKKARLPFVLSTLFALFAILSYFRLIKKRENRAKGKTNSIKEYKKYNNPKDGIKIGGYDKNEHILIEADRHPRDKAKEKEYRKNSILIKKEDEISHFILIGQSGTGKTVLSTQIFEQLKERNSKMIIHDNKMDYTAKFYNPNKDYIFNPLDERGIGWSLLNDIESIIDIESVANSLIPAAKYSDPFWNSSARSIFIEILKFAKANNISLNKELVRLLNLSRTEMIKELNSSVVAKLLESEKQAVSILSVLHQYTRSLEYLKDGDFSVKTWVSLDENNSIFITNRKDMQDMISPILTLFIDLLSKQLLSLNDNLQRRVYFILEELGMLNKLSSIVDLITNGRSKGASIFISIQDLARLEEIYGKEFNTIFANCGTKIFFRIGDNFTLNYLKSFGGSIEVEKIDENISLAEQMEDGNRHLRVHSAKEELLQANLLTNLDSRVFLIKPKDFNNFLELKTYVKEYKNYNNTFLQKK